LTAQLKRPVFWFAALAAVVLGSLLPWLPVGFGLDLGDKVMHGVAYAVLAFLSLTVFRRRRHSLLALAATVATGPAIELVQPLTGRAFEWFDMLANLLGIIVGLAAVYVVNSRERQRVARLGAAE
jgi:VanZ family protein